MIICGVDMSVNSPAVVRFELDEEFNVVNKKYLTFSQVKKYGGESSEGKVISFKKASFAENINQYTFMRDMIIETIGEADYVAFEGYAYSAMGQVFDIAEATASVKIGLFDSDIPFRIYDISSIKMFATTNGNADKISMEEEYEKLGVDEKFNLSFLPMVHEKKSGNPKDNIVDAFFVCKLLHTEMKLRHGRMTLKDLDHPKKIGLFNRVTKSNPVNILDTEFIKK